MMFRVKKRLTGLLLVQLAGAMFVCTPLTATTQANDRILLNVTVTTEKGDVIPDLSRENFSVSVEKRPQNILSFHSEVPASVGILIDTSGSLQRSDSKTRALLKQNLKAGLERFVQIGYPSNEYFLMTFDNDIQLLQDWTSEHADITNKVDSLEFKGQTSLYDSLIKAVAKVTAGRKSRHVLIIISDGEDSYSRNEKKDVHEALKRSDVVLYALGIVKAEPRVTSMYHRPSLEALEEFANLTGGRPLFSVQFPNSAAFTQAFESIAFEFRSQYQLAISAEQSVGKEKWNKLSVSVARNDSTGKPQKFIVRTSKGYYR